MADVTANSKGVVATDGSWISTSQIYRPIVNEKLSESDGPGLEARGLVAPSMERPVFTASKPSQTIATTGPAAMYLIKPGKKGLSLRSS